MCFHNPQTHSHLNQPWFVIPTQAAGRQRERRARDCVCRGHVGWTGYSLRERLQLITRNFDELKAIAGANQLATRKALLEDFAGPPRIRAATIPREVLPEVRRIAVAYNFLSLL